MSKVLRKIIEIDEEKCDGCGNCIPSCAEGALAIVEGKARIVKDMYCDGLGACLGHCPQDALRIIEREADEFDEEAAMEYVRRSAEAHKADAVTVASGCPGGKIEVFEPTAMPKTMACGCSGSLIQDFSREKPAPVNDEKDEQAGACPCSGGKFARKPEAKASPKQRPAPAPAQDESELSHWPVQLRLVPPHAPFLKDADLLLAADCVPVAYARFHEDFLKGRRVLIGCPKFDDAQDYVQRLAAIFREARPRSLTLLRMEVPCCGALTQIVNAALRISGVDVPVKEMVITRQGKAVEPDLLAARR